MRISDHTAKMIVEKLKDVIDYDLNFFDQEGLCPQAEKLYEEIMSLPLYYAMKDEDVEDVIHAVKKVVEYYRK